MFDLDLYSNRNNWSQSIYLWSGCLSTHYPFWIRIFFWNLYCTDQLLYVDFFSTHEWPVAIQPKEIIFMFIASQFITKYKQHLRTGTINIWEWMLLMHLHDINISTLFRVTVWYLLSRLIFFFSLATGCFIDWGFM